CHIHHNGRTYPSAIGLQLSGAGHVISHNEIHHTTYSGVGSSASTTRFEANLFYDIMQVLSDGGAIYITFCADVTMRGNVVRGGTGTQLSHAYYIDEQGERCVVEGNLAVNTRWPAHNHMARGGVIRRNVFIDAGDARLTFMRCADFTVAENIIVAGGALTVSAPPTGITAMPKNVLWSGQGVITLETLPEDDYQTRASAPLAPRDGTVIADPHLNGAAFGPDSPAAALGIPPLDISAAGRSRRE
ncbi:MAG TPA: right-handed parallel beta-helix repeat-containing protein, partial [Armatimonadota bacterium]|nr:right-handed parallel beta-helix repeat-containing protein [Armatimonadota bacterium]